MKRNGARGRRKKTVGGGKGQPASGSAINYKVALGCSESLNKKQLRREEREGPGKK